MFLASWLPTSAVAAVSWPQVQPLLAQCHAAAASAAVHSNQFTLVLAQWHAATQYAAIDLWQLLAPVTLASGHDFFHKLLLSRGLAVCGHCCLAAGLPNDPRQPSHAQLRLGPCPGLRVASAYALIAWSLR